MGTFLGVSTQAPSKTPILKKAVEGGVSRVDTAPPWLLGSDPRSRVEPQQPMTDQDHAHALLVAAAEGLSAVAPGGNSEFVLRSVAKHFWPNAGEGEG